MYRKSLLQSINGLNEIQELDKTLQREIHMARNIQMKLLNGEMPYLEQGEVSGISIPARLIGGDYYDFYPLQNGKLRIVIGDVMGKGIPAAMLMILTRGAFRSAAEATKGPGEALTAMNNALYQDLRKLNSFVTVFCADWDANSGILTYSNAGHGLPIVICATGEVKEVMESKGVMIGGLPDQLYTEQQIQLEHDDVVFFYTDGIVEAKNRSGQMFRIDRLIQLLVDNVNKDVGTIERVVAEEIEVFTEGLPQRDDITMVILKVGKQDSEIVSYNAPVVGL